MTQLLKKAFDTASRLDDHRQDEVARWLLEELADEQRWDESFAQSQDLLSRLADEALAEHREGKTQALNPDAL